MEIVRKLNFFSFRSEFSCNFIQETFTTNWHASEPTPTPPTTPQDCQICTLTGTNNSIAPIATNVPPNKTTIKKLKNKWNCCISVPDSPDDPRISSEPMCLISLCKHKVKSRHLSDASQDGRSVHRTHGQWSTAKLRVLFRILGNYSKFTKKLNKMLKKNVQVIIDDGIGPTRRIW